MAVNGSAAIAASAGVLLAWSGIRGWSVLGSLGDVVTGHQPKGSNLYPVGGNSSQGGSGSGGGSVGDLAGIGLSYVGHPYSFGGAPGRNGDHPWDCSSMWDWILGVKENHAIPGTRMGRYDGSSHGPTTIQWGAWSALASVPRNQIQRNDFIISFGHMGVATTSGDISGSTFKGKMVSALNSREGTKETGIVLNGPLLKIGRLRV